MESRVLKFRVFDPIRKVMKDDTSAKDILYNRSRSTVGYFDECPIMQFTGLTDKNGKDIYEGDLLKTFDNRLAKEGVVLGVKYGVAGYDIYNPSCCKICKESFGAISPISEWYSKEAFEIIGNIYENPELLTPQTA